MRVTIEVSKVAMARQAARRAASIIRSAIGERGEARIILATGASQFEFINFLTSAPNIDWTRVTGFHLDEYVGLPSSHKASFRAYMRERFIKALPSEIRAFHEVNGEALSPKEECRRLDALINAAPVDIACVGIGENGHLAFNDPPANFDCEDAYIVVELDHKCRMQQVGEGWFESLDDVPKRAFTMSIRQIMRAQSIVCTVPDIRKAEAVKNTIEGKVCNLCPASILQTHPDCDIFLDNAAASLLK